MRILKALFLLVIVLFCFSCGSDSTTTEYKEAKGGKYYGGVFKYNEESNMRHLFPLNIRGTIGHRASLNLYEGLIGLTQKDLHLKPAIAEKWTLSPDGKVYTFTLRKGVKFHDDPCFPTGKGREVKAADFKYNFDLLCTSFSNNAGSWIFNGKVVGAKEHIEATKRGETPEGGVRGVRVIDEYTLAIDLIEPFPDFLQLLATPFAYSFPKEAYEKYGIDGLRTHAVGTGPFKVKKIIENQDIILVRNPNYWGVDEHGNQLPYLDGVRISFIKELKSALLEFEKGNLDLLFRIPYEMADDIMDENMELRDKYAGFTMQMTPNLSTEYYGFQTQTYPFNNKTLRQAFCYAVDREKIVNFVAKKMAQPNYFGIVPMAFKNVSGYNYEKLKGYDFDPVKARQLLAEAGYPEGKGLGKMTLQINAGGGKNQSVAEAIQNQLQENLGIEVEILQLMFSQHYENIETAKTNFWRGGWVADYVSPENFLRFYYGPEAPDKLSEKTYLNTGRFKNAEFDALFEKAIGTIDDTKRQELYLQADQLLIDEAVCLPLFSNKDVRLLQSDVKNFPQNAMEYRYFTDVYFSPK